MPAKIDVWLDEERQIVRQVVVGDMDADDFMRLDAETTRVVHHLRDPGCVKILFDSRQSEKASQKARRLAMETLRRPALYRLSVFGASRVARMMMRFIVLVSGEKKIRAFDREKEALDWLLS
jgi:hypothetical protein